MAPGGPDGMPGGAIDGFAATFVAPLLEATGGAVGAVAGGGGGAVAAGTAT